MRTIDSLDIVDVSFVSDTLQVWLGKGECVLRSGALPDHGITINIPVVTSVNRRLARAVSAYATGRPVGDDPVKYDDDEYDGALIYVISASTEDELFVEIAMDDLELCDGPYLNVTGVPPDEVIQWYAYVCYRVPTP